MGKKNNFVYGKDFGNALNKHDGFNKMLGWFQKLLRSNASAQREKETNVFPANSVSSTSSPFPSSSPSVPLAGKTLCESPQLPSALNSPFRWSREYDVFLCHSTVDTDSEEAGRLVSFLEASPRNLRCFLRQRDDCPGGAVSTELCQALQNSHLWALLITPNFLQDDWCQYVMQQALVVDPMSCRIIPMIQNLSHPEYPQELKYCYYIDLNRNPNQRYMDLNNAVLTYLEKMAKTETIAVSNSNS